MPRTLWQRTQLAFKLSAPHKRSHHFISVLPEFKGSCNYSMKCSLCWKPQSLCNQQTKTELKPCPFKSSRNKMHPSNTRYTVQLFIVSMFILSTGFGSLCDKCDIDTDGGRSSSSSRNNECTCNATQEISATQGIWISRARGVDLCLPISFHPLGSLTKEVRQGGKESQNSLSMDG